MLVESVVLTLALNAEVFAATVTPAQAPAPQENSFKQALGDLTRQEQAEMEPIRRQMREQTKTVERKYRQQRFQIMEQNRPGSTTRMKQMSELRDQNEDAMDALNDKEWAELQALPKPVEPRDRKAINVKYKAQRDALREDYDKKMQALRPTPASPTAQPAAAPHPKK